MCWTLALWGGVPAESEHIGMLAAATGKRIVVQTTGGRGWVYDPEEGDGSSVYVMWDGDELTTTSMGWQRRPSSAQRPGVQRTRGAV